MKSNRDPRRSLNFLDSCAFDPKYAPEHEAAEKIRQFYNEGAVVLNLTHSNQNEIDHWNTPAEVKGQAALLICSLETSLNPGEHKQKAAIHNILAGNGNPEKFAADAAHVFEAAKYHGYFITTDERILQKKAEIESVCAAVVVRPSQWLSIFESESK